MCGIAGAMGQSPNIEWVTAEISRLRHRGPDHQRVETFNSLICMGSARLAMTDPNPRSNQPLSINSGRQRIVFNGEIYNFVGLREHLKSHKIQFVTESDTEVLAHWLNIYGALGVNSLEGMFSFAFFDSDSKKLLLARDSLGKKPLYWKREGGQIYWSSNWSNFPGQRDFSFTALTSYLTLGYLVDPLTLDCAVEAVKPGSVLEIDEKGTLKEWQLCRFPQTKMPSIKAANSTTKLRDTIISAVQSRIQGHPEMALSLSGGVDSAVLAISLKELGSSPTCFSAWWKEVDKTKYNVDAEIAAKICEKLNFEFMKVEVMQSKSLMDYIDKVISAMNEPNNNPTSLTLVALYSKIAEEGFRLVLTGDGADEIFGGYSRHLMVNKWGKIPKFRSERLGTFILGKSVQGRKLSHKFAHQILDSEAIESWLYWHQVFTAEEICSMSETWHIDKRYVKELKETLYSLSKLEAESTSTRKLMDRDHQIWLANESNRKLDRISMMYSIEARSPFQDESVIDLAREGFQFDSQKQLNKTLLRKAFPELDALGVRKDKAGFISPLGYWLRGNEPVVQKLMDFLVSTTGFREDFAHQLMSAPKRGNFQEMKKLWTLIIFARWQMTFTND